MIYDTIIVGLGAMGSATLLQLARRGQRVLGIDRWDPPHSWGSTHGDTRITRCAIGEGEAYVPLVQRSHALWREMEAETGADLLTQCGAMILAPANSHALVHGKSNFVRRTIAAAERFGIAHDVMDADETMRRFPQFRLDGEQIVYFEPSGGYVRPERCVATQLLLAKRAGATVVPNTQVTAIERDGGGARVVTADRTFHAAEIVLSAGAWSPGLADPAHAPAMRVSRQVLHWFQARDPAAFSPDRCPVYIWMHGDGPNDSFYGFPTPPGTEGVKVAKEVYDEWVGDPDHLVRDVGPTEAAELHRERLAMRLPGLLPVAVRSAVCPYTVTPDGDFVIDRAPGNDRVLLVSACSGHGFKHSAGLGEAVAAMLVGADGISLTPFEPRRLAEMAG